ncbi:SubName: Full=Uncharacterized protein {ECO:0000313/EMBL:CCA70344.1} [Serendipita indica DSM 11827]|uniref:Uncharacterized protein n=1 Tax=Serendipita indica (strain DSM 11827) TaxID=1109443 RepID=G4TG98_SERID|nr:SubName: Full=Uncharacterized protein {ECO:0000313/EMBL:CCA70344.1} [Serendipita indica DSM 11827]CCA70344.1 hypothetical protein PIIN_04283 [Serendipita indica DSM 11827]
MSNSDSSRPRDDTPTSSSEAGQPAADQNHQAAKRAGPPVNFPSVLHVGRYFDGDTDEVNVIVCTQRTRRRHNGELPRCYTFGWRHINNYEVNGKSIPLPPKFGQSKEVPGYWKERVIGPNDSSGGWTSIDEEGDEAEQAFNVIDKRDVWREGNYISYGTGSASALEKIQGMHVPLRSYDAHRRFREDIWSTERVAERLAKEHAKRLKRELKGKQMAEQIETRAIHEKQTSSGLLPQSQYNQRATTSLSTAASQPDSSSSTASASSSSPPESSNDSASPPVKAQTTTLGGTKPTPKAQASKPPTQPPNDNRFGPDAFAPPAPWYQRMWNYRPGTTAWTADEQYAHRSYIIPHPLEAMKNNLVRSWTLVLTPTWKLLKGMKESVNSGLPKTVLLEMWKLTADDGQRKLIKRSKEAFDKKVAEEEERQRLEREDGTSSNDRNGERSS